MTFEHETKAARGDIMPRGLHLYDQLLYQSLATLYARYRTGSVTRDQAAKDKGCLMYEWQKNRTRSEAADKLAVWHFDLKKRIEAAHNAYRKNPTAENAEKLSKVLDGILRE